MAEILSEELNQKLIEKYIGDPDFQKLCSDEIDRIFYAGGTNEPPSASNDNGTDDSVKGIARLYQERKNAEKQNDNKQQSLQRLHQIKILQIYKLQTQ